jgi:hypothetical protein
MQLGSLGKYLGKPMCCSSFALEVEPGLPAMTGLQPMSVGDQLETRVLARWSNSCF